MRNSPLASRDLAGPPLTGYIAGACVFRTDVFRAVGGYEPRLFTGGEEELVALDLLASGRLYAQPTELTTRATPIHWRPRSRHRFFSCHRCRSLRAQFVCTSIRRGRASSRRGIVSFSTPSCRFASIFDVSKSGLSENARADACYLPTSITSPMNSCPRMSPDFIPGMNPSNRCRSDPQIAQLDTVRMASRGCSIVGSGT